MDGLSRREALGGALGAVALGATPHFLKESRPILFRNPEALAELDRLGDPAPMDEIVRAWRALPPVPGATWHPIDLSWTFALGSPAEGLHAERSQMPGAMVPTKVPHRINVPDTPFWYRSTFELSRDAILRINADDGAHLFVDGNRIVEEPGVFRVPGKGGEREIVVRVLNKAVAGGLGAIQEASLSDYEQAVARSAERDRLDRCITKLRLMIDPPKGAIAQAREAIRNNGALTSLEKSLASYPMMSIPVAVHSTTPDRAILAWETDTETKPSVRYRHQGRELSAKVETEDGRFHRATLEGLQPDALVDYAIDGYEPARFRTLPATGDFAFTIWGDPHIGYDRFRQNVAALVREPAAFTVGVGDQVVSASEKTPWEEFFALGAPLFRSTPAFFMGGNHDYDGCFETLVSTHHDRYARLGGKPWHAWTVGNARFVALDPNVQFPTGIDGEQRTWFLHETESPDWKAATWRFVFVHQPPYSQGWTDYSGDLPIRALLDPLIEPRGIDFVVSGHTHDYEHLERTYGRQRCHFLIVGGAGGGLEDGPLTPEPQMEKVIRRHHFGRFAVSDHRVQFTAVATDCLVLDSFEVTR